MKEKLFQRSEVDRRYYLATEENFLDMLDKVLEDKPWDQTSIKENKIAAFLLGNSYILKVIARLPDDQFDTIYVCDSDGQVIDYVGKLIECVRESSDYNNFKENIKSLNKLIVQREKKSYTGNIKHILDYESYGYDYDAWVKERFLDEALFNICKENIEKCKFHIEFKHRYIQQVHCEKPIGLINFSNVHNFIGNKRQSKAKKHTELCSCLNITNKVAILSSEIPAADEKRPQEEVRLIVECSIFDKVGTIGYKYFARNENEGRGYHFFEVQGRGFHGLKVKAYQRLKGDHLKSKILEDFQNGLNVISSLRELDAFIEDMKATDEYKVLAYGQGIITSIFHFDTSTVKALQKMMEGKRTQLALEPQRAVL